MSKKLIMILVLYFSIMVINYGKDRIVDIEKVQNRNEIYYIINEDKPFNGSAISYWDNEKIKSKGNIKNGKLDGEVTVYYSNGQISSKENMKKGKKVGQCITYYRNGQIKSKENYIDGELSGKQIVYYENGQTEYKVNYVLGKAEGVAELYYETGRIKMKYNYKNGELNEEKEVKNNDDEYEYKIEEYIPPKDVFSKQIYNINILSSSKKEEAIDLIGNIFIKIIYITETNNNWVTSFYYNDGNRNKRKTVIGTERMMVDGFYYEVTAYMFGIIVKDIKTGKEVYITRNK